MKLGDGVEQAVHCVLALSGLPDDGVLPASALAEYHGVSTSYLLKHLQALSGAGILISVPGPKGGYRLARAPSRISLLDIVLAVEGPEPAFRCGEIRQRGPDPIEQKFFKKPCGINAAMLRAEQAYRAELRKVRITELIGDTQTSLGAAITARSCAFIDRHQRRVST
ncbi:Rrf2 family transcriptional regulator [Devosia sp. A8/3-2]|nr:Rrf2 family transcriptional regulator [Devosia sp. A8/3-2]